MRLSLKQEVVVWAAGGLGATGVLLLSHTFWVTRGTYAYGLGYPQ